MMKHKSGRIYLFSTYFTIHLAEELINCAIAMHQRITQYLLDIFAHRLQCALF